VINITKMESHKGCIKGAYKRCNSLRKEVVNLMLTRCYVEYWNGIKLISVY